MDDNNAPEIQYPCEWTYKIIGVDIDNILITIEEAVLGLDYDITPSNVSKNGKYVSLNLKLEVPNEVVRNLIFENLIKSPNIKYIL